MKTIIPKIKFELMSLEEISGILEWSIIIDEGILPTSEYVLKLYPELNNIKNWKDFSAKERTDNIRKLIEKSYINDSDEYKNILRNYEIIWEKYNNDFMKNLSKVLNINWSKELQEITIKVGKIPIYPRELEKYCFYIGKMNKQDFIETVMYECCHFLYFEKWKYLFKNWKIEEFESPHIIWYLSEIAIDPILNNLKIQEIYIHNFKAYKNFYDIDIQGKNLMETIKNIYNENTIENAIIKSYEYILKNKKSITKS